MPELVAGWAILAAKRSCDAADWNEWADGWLSGEDRTPESACEARNMLDDSQVAWGATWAATRAAERSVWAAESAENAATYAYVSADDRATEIECQIIDALEIIGKEQAI